MTRRQREALKLAMEALRREIRQVSPQTDLVKYKELAQALQVIEEMLRGTQGELPI